VSRGAALVRSLSGRVNVVRATPFALDTVLAANGLYYAQPACAGLPLIKVPKIFVAAVGTTEGAGSGIFRVPLDAGAIVNYQSRLDIASGLCGTVSGSERLTANFATVDLSSLVPPYRLEKQ